MSNATPSIHAILCEDIREELNRKYSLFGVFSGDIHVPHFPANIKMAIYVEFLGFPKGEHDVGGEVTYGGTAIFKLEAKMNVLEGQVAVLIMPSIFVPIAEEGQLEIKVKGADGEPRTVISKHISVGEIPSLVGTPAS